MAVAVFDTLAKSARTASAMAPAVVERYARSGSFDNTREAFALLQGIPQSAWSPALVERVRNAARENNQVGHAVLNGGRPIPDAVEEMLALMTGAETPVVASDHDIPF